MDLQIVQTNDALITALHRIWKRTDLIFSLITPEAMLLKPIFLRHPFLFYLGHIPCFYNIQINQKLFNEPALNAQYDLIFERGIDPDVKEPTKCHLHSITPDIWPPNEAVEQYRDLIRQEVINSFEKVKNLIPTTYVSEHCRIYFLTIEHEIMHQETLMYMYQQLDNKYKVLPCFIPPPIKQKSPVTFKMVHVNAGEVTLGRDRKVECFGWDNEFQEHRVFVKEFEIENVNVTNRRFMEFVTSGEYENKVYWRQTDWEWKETNKMRFPTFWVQRDGVFFVRTLFEEILLEEVGDWPVFVSWAEASAYSKWKGKKLMTEAQYHRAAFSIPNSTEQRELPWGNEVPNSKHGNFNWVNWYPSPVGTHPDGQSAWGVHDLIGDAWEWTSTPFNIFPGFQPLENYLGYSADFFEGNHYVLKGASFATDAMLIRRSFRNWYQDIYPFMFAKFRLVADV